MEQERKTGKKIRGWNRKGRKEKRLEDGTGKEERKKIRGWNMKGRKEKRLKGGRNKK